MVYLKLVIVCPARRTVGSPRNNRAAVRGRDWDWRFLVARSPGTDSSEVIVPAFEGGWRV
jgi:hypothetical protein